MKIEILPDADSVARRGAVIIDEQAKVAIAERGRFVFAVSGGSTPWLMLRQLAKENLPWEQIHIVQVDERIAPAGHTDRNLTHLTEALEQQSGLPTANIHAMPVNEPDLSAAAAAYVKTLESLAGSPPVIDLVHLGLGTDGHTASLVPADPVLKVNQTDVSTTGEYQGRRRMTLTYPCINRARQILWLVTGDSKAEAVSRMADADAAIPAGRIRQSAALLIVDDAAASHLSATLHDREAGED